MGNGPPRAAQKDKYVAIIDQDKVTDEVRNIALNYDPLNQAGRHEGFHLTEDGELHIDDEVVIEEHTIIANKIPNDAIKIVRLPAERGELIHQYGENGFRLYELPAPTEGRVVGLLGPNGTGKSTALRILGGLLTPNLGNVDNEPEWDVLVQEFRGTAVQTYLEKLRDREVRTIYKPQRVDRIAEHYDGTVGELITERDDRTVSDALIEHLDLEHITDRLVTDLSGGELQRVAIAATIVADVDTYLIDEPSSYLDVGQRLTVARVLNEFAAQRNVLVVDHDLIMLDIIADTVHVFYGESGGFGVVSRPLSTRRGINQFIEGFLRAENTRIRDTALDFHQRRQPREAGGTRVLDFPTLTMEFDSFSLEIEPGIIFENEVLGIMGRHGLGKTTFAKLLAGAIEPDLGRVNADISISYKPQYLDPTEGTVQELVARHVDSSSRGFETWITDSFGLEPLVERDIADLSGGELQRVSIALALARDADMYLFDEPSAFLDSDQRMSIARTLRRFVGRNGTPCLVIDHDLLLLDYVSDRAMVFEGEPGIHGVGRSPRLARDGMNHFLSSMGVTFRKDPSTGRPRANKPGSQLDRQQKDAGTYYAIE